MTGTVIRVGTKLLLWPDTMPRPAVAVVLAPAGDRLIRDAWGAAEPAPAAASPSLRFA